MSITLRPARRWAHLLKYYIIGFILVLPYSVEFLRNMEHQLVVSIVDMAGSGAVGSTVSSVLPSGVLKSLALPLFGIGLFLIITAEVRRLRIKYIVYEDRVVKKVGIFMTSIKDVSYDHADSISAKRSIIDKILGTADLTIQTPSNMESMKLRGMGQPSKWSEYMMKRASFD